MKNDSPTWLAAGYRWSMEWNVRFADTDAVGHLNNVSVFRYHDNAAVAFLHEQLVANEPATASAHPAILRQSILLDAEAFFPDPLTLCARVGDIQSHGFVLELGMFQNGTCTSTSTAVIACVNALQETLALPDNWIARLQPFTNPATENSIGDVSKDKP